MGTNRPTETGQAQFAVTPEHFNELRKLSVALDPEAVSGNSIDFMVQVPEVILTGDPNNSEPALRSVSAGWVKQNKVQTLTITEQTFFSDERTRNNVYKFMVKEAEMLFAGFRQQVRSSDGSEYAVERDIEDRDMMALIETMAHFSVVSAQTSAMDK